MVQIILKEADLQSLKMADMDLSQPRLPVVKIERRALKVNTSALQFKPTSLPVCSHHIITFDKPGDTRVISGKKVRKDRKYAWSDGVQNPPVTRYWESTFRPTYPPATPISAPDMTRQRADDKENFPVIRSKSAPTKLVYMDKSGNISPRARGEGRLTRSCRPAIGRGGRDSEAKRGGSDVVRHAITYPQQTIKDKKDAQAGTKAKRLAWNDEANDERRTISDLVVKKGSSESGTSNAIDKASADVDEIVTNETETEQGYSHGVERGSALHSAASKHSHRSVDDTADSLKARYVRNKPLRVQTDVLRYLRSVVANERKRTKTCIAFAVAEAELEYDNEKSYGHREVSGLFHNAIHFVRMVVRLLASMTDLSAEMTSRSATEERWHALNTSRQAREMAFNKTAFAKRKGFYKLPRWAKCILEKAPDDRTEAELRRIHALLRGLKSFDKFTEKIQLSMCRSFTYHSVASGRIILRQGHVGLNFYFLYTGSVFVNTEDTDVQGNIFSKTEVVLRRGDSFGELALLQDIRRTATISCREDCELLVVDKDTFAKVCPKIFEREMDEKMKFLNRLPLFSPKYWEEETLEKMCFEAQIQEYKTSKVVVADNTKDDWIYLCMSGKCQIIRRLNLSEEIEWRRMQQSTLGMLSNRSRPGDYDARGSIADRETLCEDEDGKSMASNLEEGKEHLLESMALDYRKTRKKPVRQNSARQADGQSSSLGPSSDQGQMTLTSFIRQEGATGQDYLYLNIKSLEQGEVFDLLTALDCHRGEADPSGGSFLLVSNGARVLRIRRTSFFKHATTQCLLHARKITKREKLPPDDVLLRCYGDQLNWQVYKQMVLRDTFETIKHEKVKTKAHARFISSDVIDDVSIDIDEAKKQTIKEIQDVLPDEAQAEKELEYWKKLETLSNKAVKSPKKQKVVAFQLDPEHEAKRIAHQLSHEQNMTSLFCFDQNAPASQMVRQALLAQRRGSVATGDLRRENLPKNSQKRRFSQPHVDFDVIHEEEDDLLADN